MALYGLFNAFEVPRQIPEKFLNHGEEKFRIVFATFALLEKDLQFFPIEERECAIGWVFPTFD